jgi:prepilin-type processing-associated H-X9-DG protein
MYYDPPNWSVGAPTRYGSDVTYGINGDDPGGQGVAPFRSLNLDTLNTLPKVTSFIRPSKLVLVYDGVYSLWSSTNGNNTIHARHNSHTTTNLLLADGHASTMPTDTLPPDNNSVFSLPALNAASPNPFWRNDQ